MLTNVIDCVQWAARVTRGGIHQMSPQFFYDYSFYNSSLSQSGCTKFFHTRKNCRKIVEDLWKNCRKILRTLDRQGRQGIIVERFSKERAQNLSTILPQFFPAACRTKARKIFLQFVYNYSTIISCWQFTLVRKQRFYGDFVEELWKNLVHAKFGEGFFLLRLTKILRGKAGKYTRGIIVEKL
jgi:hypothetical protein